MSNTLAERSKEVTKTDPKVDTAAREKLITARIGLLLKAPFFGNLATRMTLINADDWCPTAATDGRRFYYNSEFVNKMPLKQVEFLVGHEVLHAVYDHMGRRGDRDLVLCSGNSVLLLLVQRDRIAVRIGVSKRGKRCRDGRPVGQIDVGEIERAAQGRGEFFVHVQAAGCERNFALLGFLGDRLNLLLFAG